MIKKIIRLMLPRLIYNRISKSYRERMFYMDRCRLRLMLRDFAAFQGDIPQAVVTSDKRILIVPSDQKFVFGSLGDEAMITAVMKIAKQLGTDIPIDVITTSRYGVSIILERGMNPVYISPFRSYIKQVVFNFRENRYSVVVSIGADSVDGSFTPYNSAKIILTADLAARAGISAAIMGFSVSKKFSPDIISIFNRTDHRLKINVRDEVSFERFRKQCRAKAILVSDAAFHLQAGVVDEETKGWISARRSEGCLVVGVNIHSMLLIGATDYEDKLRDMIDKVSSALIDTSERRRVAWLVMPHDYRIEAGDLACLTKIYERVGSRLGDRAFFLSGRRVAGELKAIAGLLDGVITGRMHLAIAALGSGTPTLCLTYFDKFEGLFNHFCLPDWLLLTPKVFTEDLEFSIQVNRFLDELLPIRNKVEECLPRVMSMSLLNFQVLTDE